MQHRKKGPGEEAQKNGSNPVLLSRTELYWLLGKTIVSKTFEYQIRSRVKKKIKTLMELDLPLLVKSNFVDSGFGRDLETGACSMITQALVRQRSREPNVVLYLLSPLCFLSLLSLLLISRYIMKYRTAATL
jgi:hypothetical protein